LGTLEPEPSEDDLAAIERAVPVGAAAGEPLAVALIAGSSKPNMLLSNANSPARDDSPTERTTTCPRMPPTPTASSAVRRLQRSCSANRERCESPFSEPPAAPARNTRARPAGRAPVTAIVRNPDRLPTPAPAALRVLAADVMDAAAIQVTFLSRDASRHY
jgi:hypothetical protein